MCSVVVQLPSASFKTAQLFWNLVLHPLRTLHKALTTSRCSWQPLYASLRQFLARLSTDSSAIGSRPRLGWNVAVVAASAVTDTWSRLLQECRHFAFPVYSMWRQQFECLREWIEGASRMSESCQNLLRRHPCRFSGSLELHGFAINKSVGHSSCTWSRTVMNVQRVKYL